MATGSIDVVCCDRVPQHTHATWVILTFIATFTVRDTTALSRPRPTLKNPLPQTVISHYEICINFNNPLTWIIA